MKGIFNAVVFPAVLYAADVWGPVLSRAMVQAELNKLQRLALLCIGSTNGNPSTVVLEMLFGLAPNDVRIKEENTMSILELRSSKH